MQTQISVKPSMLVCGTAAAVLSLYMPNDSPNSINSSLIASSCNSVKSVIDYGDLLSSYRIMTSNSNSVDLLRLLSKKKTLSFPVIGRLNVRVKLSNALVFQAVEDKNGFI
jgi:hypothetical protein